MIATRRALLTGLSGFLGHHLARRLVASNIEVVCGLANPTIDKTGRVDVRDRGAVRALLESTQPEVIYHLAGRIKTDEPESLYDINVIGMAVLLDAIQTCHLKPR